METKKNETGAFYAENAKNLKLSDHTKIQIIALAKFEDSFWHLSDVLTEKSEDEKIQEAFNLSAEKSQEKARNFCYKTLNEMINLIKDEIFQTLFCSDYQEI